MTFKETKGILPAETGENTRDFRRNALWEGLQPKTPFAGHGSSKKSTKDDFSLLKGHLYAGGWLKARSRSALLRAPDALQKRQGVRRRIPQSSRRTRVSHLRHLSCLPLHTQRLRQQEMRASLLRSPAGERHPRGCGSEAV